LTRPRSSWNEPKPRNGWIADKKKRLDESAKLDDHGKEEEAKKARDAASNMKSDISCQRSVTAHPLDACFHEQAMFLIHWRSAARRQVLPCPERLQCVPNVWAGGPFSCRLP
jgi:hypothetical protein